MSELRLYLDLLESKKTLEQRKLSYSRSALAPVLSKANIDNHYGKLYKGYVDRYNAGEGDKTFNEAGAYLHDIVDANTCGTKTSLLSTDLSLEADSKTTKSKRI